MNQSEFEAELRRDGYQIVYNGFRPGEVNADHSHDWDARLLILGGEISITRGGKTETFRAAGTCSVPAGERHAEHVGRQGVTYIAGRRPAR
jgi:quercetin dioxygenase-like cupin family protein